MKISLTETNREFTITLSKPGLKYVDFFLSQKSAGQLVSTGFYPNAKEISETVGVFDQARRFFSLDHQDPRIAFICVGDGKVPRTGLYCAYMTRWQVLSVDPAMQEGWHSVQNKVARTERLSLYPQMIEDTHLNLSDETAHIILAFVHSHASLHASLASVRRALDSSKQKNMKLPNIRIDAISLPCCVEDDLGLQPSDSIEDDNILSARKKIYFYRNIEQNFFC